MESRVCELAGDEEVMLSWDHVDFAVVADVVTGSSSSTVAFILASRSAILFCFLCPFQID